MHSNMMSRAILSVLAVFFLTLALGVMVAPAAFATHGGDEPPIGKRLPTGPTTGLELLQIIDDVTDWIFSGFLIFAVIFIIVAAFQFITGGGEPAQVSQARMKLLWAVIAIAIAAAAKGIPVVVRHIAGLS